MPTPTTTVLTAQGPFLFTLLGYVNSAGEVVADLTTVAAGSLAIANNLSELTATADTALGNLGATATGIALFQAPDEAGAQAAIGATSLGSDLIEAEDAAAARTAIGTNVAWYSMTVAVAATTAGLAFVNIPSEVRGDIDFLTATNSANPGGNLGVTLAIGTSGGSYTAVTGGAVTVANAAAAGTRFSATPSADKTVIGGVNLVRVAWDNGAANPIVITVQFGVTRI